MYFRLSILGRLLTTESFSVNLTFDPEGEAGWNYEGAVAMVQAAANTVVPASLLSCLSSSGSVLGARLEGRDDATDALIGVTEYFRPAPAQGTGTLAMAPQSSIVCSLRTDSPGASGRGRIYWPALAATLTGQGRLNNPSSSNLISGFSSYFSSLEANMLAALGATPPWLSLNLAVRSKKLNTSPHVTRLQVGDIIDTQRRRRDKLPESYTTAAYPAA